MNGILDINSTLRERYIVRSFIGEGGMQRVYLADDLVLSRKVALKTPKNTSAEKRFHRSAVVAAKVNHPNVAKTYDYFEENDRAVLVEEFVPGEDLQKSILDRANYMDPYMAACVFHRLSRGLAASHRVSVIHRDLKPTNIIVSGGLGIKEIKITDFGIAKMAEEEITEAAEQGEETISASATAVGALPYMAPEVIETPRDVTCAVDIWSLGAMMFELLTGTKPFGTGLRAVGRITQGVREPIPGFVEDNPQFGFLSKQLLNIIDKCLDVNVSTRPSAQDVVLLCENLCYSVDERYEGVVDSFRWNSWGFIDCANSSVFFHRMSVFGQVPKIGEKVVFSKYNGGQAPRAYPVVRLKS